MLDKDELNRRRAKSRRDKARNRREEEEEEKAEAKRRRAQSQRDKARNRREEEERISRITGAVQRQLALDCQQKLPPAVPEEPSSTVLLVAIMEARSSKVMRDIARYTPSRLTRFYLICIGCLKKRDTPMLRWSFTVENYPFIDPSSAHKANTSKRPSKRRSLREAQGCSHSTMIVRPPTGWLSSSVVFLFVHCQRVIQAQG
jgi:hypothetical protein